MTLREKIENNNHGIILYSFAPPKITTDASKLEAIAGKQIERINQFNIDGVILYDIQDESHRTNEPRTYPFIPTVPPENYLQQFLHAITPPVIVYKSIANQNNNSFEAWLDNNPQLEHLVFVGASSNTQATEAGFLLSDAYAIKKNKFNHLLLGGVTIPERHTKKGNEHQRLFEKTEQGCSFFVSQCVYNLDAVKNLLSDYYYASIVKGVEARPIFFTLSPCGSFRTLEFMQWLGIEIPAWLYNDLKHSKDILQESIRTSINIANEILAFASSKKIPVGFNIESISNKKEEIEAATEILNRVRGLV